MDTARNENGEIFKFTENRNPLFQQLKEKFRITRNRYSWLKRTSWILLIPLATFMWQCDHDDFDGETVGICPEVIATDPTDGAIDVVSDKVIMATFNEAMDSLTINATTFTLKKGSELIAGTVTFSDSTAFFIPTSNLSANTIYTGTITTGARDLAGNALVEDYVWIFNTGNLTGYNVILASMPLIGGKLSGGGVYASGTSVMITAVNNPGYEFINWTDGGSPVSVNAAYAFIIESDRTLVANFSTLPSFSPGNVILGSAGDFAILAGSGVSNTGVSTMITGNVGAFPTATMNGLLPGNVNGTLYTTADPIVGLAKTDLTIAYNDAQIRSTNAISLPGQIGGLTLAPGLYVNSISSGISGTGPNGILTLDAGGNANAVWIFKIGSTLVTDAGTSIVLAGGAQAKNIYWSVGTSATLGTNSIFYGNILADQSITLTTGVTLYGRALTRIGAVTLDSNTVVKPL
ncbi:MAG: ice-binding family protein [Bacteroidales bacterium]|nr:ice-binding family protein [Bacteroidales bacterium]